MIKVTASCCPLQEVFDDDLVPEVLVVASPHGVHRPQGGEGVQDVPGVMLAVQGAHDHGPGVQRPLGVRLCKHNAIRTLDNRAQYSDTKLKEN